jgi:hypothetical protein
VKRNAESLQILREASSLRGPNHVVSIDINHEKVRNFLFYPLKPKLLYLRITISPYREGNTTLHRYKDQPVNAV